MSVQMTYTGPDGNVNYDVSREIGGPALMKTGEKYTVSEDLAARLLIGGGWEAPKSRRDGLMENADKQGEDANEEHVGAEHIAEEPATDESTGNDEGGSE